MAWGVRWRLSLMTFLEYAIWGASAVVLGACLGRNLAGRGPGHCTVLGSTDRRSGFLVSY